MWWDGELFSGRPDWDKLLAYPKAQLTEEEQAFIDGPTEELCAMVSDWQIGQQLDLPAKASALAQRSPSALRADKRLMNAVALNTAAMNSAE